MDQPAIPPSSGAVHNLPSCAWWLVLCLVGLDYFSTLAYLPSVVVNPAERVRTISPRGLAR